MNTFGSKLRLTTFGESHGVAIGGVIDGLPSGIKIDENFIQSQLEKRKPGSSKFTTARNESDKVELLSGILDGISTGTPIGFIIRNENQKSNDYENLRELFRPGHADFTYFAKYGIRDYRGGGRASARETAVRVVGGAIAQLMLDGFGIFVQSGVVSVGKVVASNLDWSLATSSEIFSLGCENEMKDEILKAKQAQDSVGAAVITQILGVPTGLGEGLYDKLDARIAAAFMGINGVKAVEIGEGVKVSTMKGSENNDCMKGNFDIDRNVHFGDISNDMREFNEINIISGEVAKSKKFGFFSNHAGGILGGISNGETINIKTHFKPTPSIFISQNTQNIYGKDTICELRGRHDPCIGVRGSVVATAMARLVIADMLLLNTNSNLDNIKLVYGLTSIK
jgi:chorismate synthase